MTSKLKLLVATSAIPLAVLGANPAYAEGTTAGTDIQNDVTVSYSVGGVAQSDETASDTFKVDRKINLTVAESDSATTQVAPGATEAITAFTVTNTSNEVLDFNLTASQLAGGTSEHGGTDNFDITGLQIFVDVDPDGSGPLTPDGVFNPAEDTETFIDELPEDGSVTVFIVGDIPGTQVTGDVAGVILTATAREGGTVGGSVGAAISESVGANTSGVDTVFADAAGETDGARDAAFSAGDDYTVSAADLTVAKFSRIVSDPINGTTNPKAIPGALIEYCIGVENASGSATATGISISDTLPIGITYDTGFGVTTNGSYDSGAGTCTAGGGTGNFSGGDVSGTLNDIAGGGNSALVFRATVD